MCKKDRVSVCIFKYNEFNDKTVEKRDNDVDRPVFPAPMWRPHVTHLPVHIYAWGKCDVIAYLEVVRCDSSAHALSLPLHSRPVVR